MMLTDEKEGLKGFGLITPPTYSLAPKPVTQAQYREVTKENPSYFKGDDLPVERVSWYDCARFCNLLSERSGLISYYSSDFEVLGGTGFRLPTEAEWEECCRAGKTWADYSFGNDVTRLGKYAWYLDNSNCKTHSVGTKLPNDWGFYDMHGNVWEWCEDLYSSSGSSRVLRGGSFVCNADDCRSASRYASDPDNHDFFRGFRVARTVEGKPYD